MQAKKRYILVFVSCAFLAYCYFGGYRLKRSRILFSTNGNSGGSKIGGSTIRRYENIIVPPNLPSFLSSIECNGINIDDFNNDSNEYINSKANAQHNHMNNNDDAFRQGSQLSSATVQTNAKFKGMLQSIIQSVYIISFIRMQSKLKKKINTYVYLVVNLEPIQLLHSPTDNT